MLFFLFKINFNIYFESKPFRTLIFLSNLSIFAGISCTALNNYLIILFFQHYSQ